MSSSRKKQVWKKYQHSWRLEKWQIYCCINIFQIRILFNAEQRGTIIHRLFYKMKLLSSHSYFQDGLKFQYSAAQIDSISRMQETKKRNTIWFLIVLTIQKETELEEFLFLMWSLKDDKIPFLGFPVETTTLPNICSVSLVHNYLLFASSQLWICV